jgi:hypothetical protein
MYGHGRAKGLQTSLTGAMHSHRQGQLTFAPRPFGGAQQRGRHMTSRTLIALAALFAAGASHAGEIRVNADQTTAVKLSQSAKTVLIGNPLIAEVTMLDDKTVYILGRLSGQTNLVAVDDKGNEIFNEKVSVRMSDYQMVTLHKGAAGPRTYSCAPKCEWVMMPGDEEFKKIQEDADKKQNQSDGAAGISAKQR